MIHYKSNLCYHKNIEI